MPGQDFIVHPTAIVDSKEIILFDAGFLGSLEQIKQEFINNDLEIKYLKKIVITHHDHDHIGALADLLDEYPDIIVYASQNEKDYIEGNEEPLRLKQAYAMQEILPDNKKAWGENFIRILSSVKKARVDVIIKDGDYIPFSTPIRVIETFGHTKGHISLYLEDAKVLISGDALVLENNELVIANPEHADNLDDARKSVLKIKELDLDKVMLYHGGTVEINGNKSIIKE